MRKKDKLIEQIAKGLEGKDLSMLDELEDFFNNLDLFEEDEDISEAQRMIEQAYDLEEKEGIKLVKKALKLEPDNVYAYLYLANNTNDINKAVDYFVKVIDISHKQLGEEFFRENTGYFWGIHETRPYMNALHGLATCYTFAEQFEDAITIYKRMLELNPSDNQGVRYTLSTLYLRINDIKSYETFIKEYDEDYNTEWTYNFALYNFIKFGACNKSTKALRKAYKNNPYVLDYLSGKRELSTDGITQFVTIGSDNEAVIYAINGIPLWKETEGALEWGIEFYEKQKKKK